MTYTPIAANRKYSSRSLRPWALTKALELAAAGPISTDHRAVPIAGDAS